VKLTSIRGELVSFFAFDNETIVTSSGLKYPLKKSNLHFGRNESISNVSKSDVLQFNVNGGILLMIRETGTVIEHDLL
jgi:thiamine pyrophosphokinase